MYRMRRRRGRRPVGRFRRLFRRALRLGRLRTGGFAGAIYRTALKTNDTVINTSTLTNGATAIYHLSGIESGANEFTRSGQKLIYKSIYIRSQCIRTAPATGPTHTIIPYSLRFMLIYDKQTNGAAPVGTDILQQFNPITGITNSSRTIDQPMNLQNRDRFIVLRDKTIANNGTVEKPAFRYDLYKKCNLKTVYSSSDTTGAISAVRSGAILLLVHLITAQGALDSQVAMQFQMYSRLKFIE